MENFTKFLYIFSILFISVNGAPPNYDAPPSTDETVHCPDKNGQYKHPLHCDKYLNCFNGVGIIEHCGHGLNFNSEISTCDYPSRVDCQGREDSRPQMDEGSVCPSGYGTFDNPKHCGQFIICHAGTVYYFDCPPGTVYNSTLGVCDHPMQGETCLDQHQTPAPPMEETSPIVDSGPVSTTPDMKTTTTTDSSSIVSVNPSSEMPTSRIPDFDFATAKPIIPSNPVLFPIIPSWSKLTNYNLLNCPEGHRMGFVPANPAYAVCVKNDSFLRF